MKFHICQNDRNEITPAIGFVPRYFMYVNSLNRHQTEKKIRPKWFCNTVKYLFIIPWPVHFRKHFLMSFYKSSGLDEGWEAYNMSNTSQILALLKLRTSFASGLE